MSKLSKVNCVGEIDALLVLAQDVAKLCQEDDIILEILDSISSAYEAYFQDDIQEVENKLSELAGTLDTIESSEEYVNTKIQSMKEILFNIFLDTNENKIQKAALEVEEPFTIDAVERHKRGLSSQAKIQWVGIANTVYMECVSKGGNPQTCEVKAIKTANSKSASFKVSKEDNSIEYAEAIANTLKAIHDYTQVILGNVNSVLKADQEGTKEASIANVIVEINGYLIKNNKSITSLIDSIENILGKWVKERRVNNSTVAYGIEDDDFTLLTRILGEYGTLQDGIISMEEAVLYCQKYLEDVDLKSLGQALQKLKRYNTKVDDQLQDIGKYTKDLKEEYKNES